MGILKTWIIFTLVLHCFSLQAETDYCASSLSNNDICRRSHDQSYCDQNIVYSYTGSLYQTLNNYLRYYKEISSCDTLVTRLKNGLMQFPVSRNRLFRGTGFISGLDKLKVGECFIEKGFMSTSLSERGAITHAHYALFEIEGAEGFDISKYSVFTAEEEVVVLPGANLKLVAKSHLGNVLMLNFEAVEPHECKSKK